MLTPTATPELRDRGWLYHRLDCFRAALADYRRYLELAPQAADADEVRGRIIELEVLAARVN
jgi:regulator of sirC expression with transglutaminase-like and TPR domain